MGRTEGRDRQAEGVGQAQRRAHHCAQCRCFFALRILCVLGLLAALDDSLVAVAPGGRRCGRVRLGLPGLTRTEDFRRAHDGDLEELRRLALELI